MYPAPAPLSPRKDWWNGRPLGPSVPLSVVIELRAHHGGSAMGRSLMQGGCSAHSREPPRCQGACHKADTSDLGSGHKLAALNVAPPTTCVLWTVRGRRFSPKPYQSHRHLESPMHFSDTTIPSPWRPAGHPTDRQPRHRTPQVPLPEPMSQGTNNPHDHHPWSNRHTYLKMISA